MPQQMNILRCSSCKTYQVHIVKKAKKWECKICYFKQILKKIYFKGSGKDCRTVVQKLNLAREHENQQGTSFDECNNTNDNSFDNYPEPKRLKTTESKWSKYSDTSEEVQVNNFEDSNSRTTYEKTDESVHTENKNAMFDGCSRNEYTNINDDSVCENDFAQTCDNVEEHSNSVVKETLVDTSNNDDNKENKDRQETSTLGSKSTRNIFDDNEDFDLGTDF